ncbi:MAG TPA: glycosyltransferase family 39 protein [Candidatus Koribacter sp.]|jgi:uncharacterized membrane protein
MTEQEYDRGVMLRVIALTALALVLRVLALGYKGFWQDEVFSVLFVREPSAQFWSVLKNAEMNMALYYLALREWVRFFHGEAGIRALSVIPGVLTVPVVYALGARLYSRRVGVWAAGLTAINTCAVVYSQEARGYAMLVLFAALSSWAFLKLAEQPTVGSWLLYVLFSVCAFYCHFYAVFVLFGHACSLFLLPAERAPWKGSLSAWLLTAVASIPGIQVIRASHGSNLWWLPRPGLVEIYRTITFLAAESGKVVGAVLAALMVVAVICGLRASWLRSNGPSVENFRMWFAPLGFLVPMLATLLLSFWRPMFFHRFLIVCLVPFLLLASMGLEQLRRYRVGVGLTAGILVLSGIATAASYSKVREDWRGAAAYTASVAPDAPVVFYIKDGAAPFAYYRDRLSSPLKAAQLIPSEQQPSEADAQVWARFYPCIWVVRFPADVKDPALPEITRDLLRHYKLCERQDFKGISVSWFCERGEHTAADFRIAH